MSEADGHLSVATKDIVEWTQAFVRHPSPQTERFEHEPQVQSFITEQVVPLVQALGLPWRRAPMGNLLVELGPERADRSLMLMAYAMTHPANRMPNPYAGEVIQESAGPQVCAAAACPSRRAPWPRRSRRRRPPPTASPCAAVSGSP